MCELLFEQILCSPPIEEHVAACVVVQLPHKCEELVGILAVSACPLLYEQVLLFTPVVVQVAGVVTDQLPQECAEESFSLLRTSM